MQGLLPNSATITSKLNEGLLAALDAAAGERGVSRSAAVRLAVEQWLGDQARVHEEAVRLTALRARITTERVAIERLPMSSRFNLRPERD